MIDYFIYLLFDSQQVQQRRPRLHLVKDLPLLGPDLC
jgi:hypothetical protein